MSRNEGSPRKGSKSFGTTSKGDLVQEEITTTSDKKKAPGSSSSKDLSKTGISSTMVAPKSPTKKATRSLSKGGLTPTEAKDLLTEIEKEPPVSNNQQRKTKNKGSKRKGSKEKKGDLIEPDLALTSEPAPPPREMTKEEIAREEHVLQCAEEKLETLKTKAAEKEIIFNKLLLELKRMMYIFSKVKEIDINTAGKELNTEPEKVIC